ncbi:hypothetical protein HOLleu_28033 [Holothuria leucospilota]|uniref:Ig-like domain-containing protein n=1 Tax=Holothuria leucospilota TaxID=206669 RepID=A0A9Q1H379_HOLLE|nr:hypothetical protein HOLleu_28033 [Holothuria leucospilota]
MISLLKLVLFFSTVLKWQGKAQNVVFELLDSEVNEVIFVGERDIVLNCSVRCVTNAVITIKRGESVMVTSDRNDGYLEYNIDEVLMGDNGEYTCTVSYVDVNTGLNVTEMETLNLNFKEERPQCFRNGTEGEPFQVGDLLLMSCYCLEDDACLWVRSIDGEGTATVVPVFETISYRGKKIQRIKEEYTIFTNINIRYDCIVGQKFCSIGPQVKSTEDTIVNKVPSDDELSRQDGECHLFQTASLSNLKLTTEKANYQHMEYMVTTNSNAEVTDRGNALLRSISFGTSGITVIFILTVVIMYIRWRRHKNKLGNKIEHQYFNPVDTNNKSCNETNTVKDTGTYYHHIQDPDGRQNDVCAKDVCPISKVNGAYEYKLPTTDETFQRGKMFEKMGLDIAIHTDPSVTLEKNKSQNEIALSVPPKDVALSRGTFELHVENDWAVYSFHLYIGEDEKKLNLKRNDEEVPEDGTSERKEMQPSVTSSEIYAEVDRSLAK